MSTTALRLASVREQMGITLEAITKSTRLAPHYLKAIEAEEFAKLPSGVYATSYIRQYARAIGYSETALLGHYHARRAEEPPPMIAVQQSVRVTSRLGEALGEAMELFHWRSSTKPRAEHPA